LVKIYDVRNAAEEKGWPQMRFAALVVSVLVICNCASQASQQGLAGASAPAECMNGYGAPQLLDAPALLDPLEKSSSQHYERGLDLYSSGDRAGAEQEFRKAIEERPTDGQFVASLTKLYVAESQPNAALEVIRSYTKVCGVTALGYALEAEVLFQQRHYEDAMGAIVSSIKLFPDNARMHQLLGLLLLMERDNTDASVELQKAEQLDPNDADIRYYYGRTLYITGHYPEARDQFLACLKNNAQYRKALENVGLSYQAVNDYVNAAKYYQQAIEREKTENAKHGEPFGYYGAMLIEMGQPKQALPVLQEGAAASPRSLVVNFELGRVLFALDQPQQAQHFLEVAEDLDPQYAQTHYLLGRLYNQQKRAPEADQEFKKFQELDKNPANREFSITDR
jgi:tetratricopeptide (TPR) repeat protein